MRVLVGCECSQVVTSAFLAVGCDAWSCDIQPSYGLYPERHIQGDLREVYQKINPDLFIAHPPCTYLSNAGVCRTFPKSGVDWLRYEKGLHARDFFLWCLSRPAPMICVENPVPMGAFGLPSPTQYIEPYEYGHPYTKHTGLWLVGLPALFPIDIVEPVCGQWVNASRSQRGRSETFSGVAHAMAYQWGPGVLTQLRLF